ncbi:MAG: hypothetical protein V3T49_04890 [Dehalococcoidia bacterium]
MAIAVGCNSESAQPEVAPTAAPLACPDCELVEVVEVIDANTLTTSIGEIRPYGSYVRDLPADCAAQAKGRLTVLAGDLLRIEPGPDPSIRTGSNNYYLYTEDGQSIEDTLIREGLALVWTQDGQHLGWFLFRSAAAQKGESGCLWKGWNAFQSGKPSDFRIPGLTYPDADS